LFLITLLTASQVAGPAPQLPARETIRKVS
jgi:hypothetical protein